MNTSIAKKKIFKKKTKNSSDLVQLVQILDGLQKQKITLDDALEFICDVCHAKRVLLVLLSPLDGDLYIEAAAGLSSEQKEQGHYVVGEGIVGKVIQSGEPMFIHDVMQNPRFLNRTNAREAREKISFLCVPITNNNTVIGALGMDTLTEPVIHSVRDAEHLERLLSVIAASFTPYIQRYQKTMKAHGVTQDIDNVQDISSLDLTSSAKQNTDATIHGLDLASSFHVPNENIQSIRAQGKTGVLSKIHNHTADNSGHDIKTTFPRSLSQKIFRGSQELVGTSESMQFIYKRIEQVAPTSTTVMIRGESGTGKELVARALHEKSLRQEKPFITLNCAALPESLVESELFGHEKGAFTSAMQTRKGRFEIADTGTLFLDEVGELSLATQARLLRVLQERSFERVGSTQSMHVDVRIITATNRPLEKMVEEGTFRKDLYYRLNVFTLDLPPLRERQSDILLLAEYFLTYFAKANNREKPKLSQAAREMLERYTWQGNIRELENTMERCIILLGSGRYVLPQHLPLELHSKQCSQCGASHASGARGMLEGGAYYENARDNAISFVNDLPRLNKSSLVDKALAHISGNFAQGITYADGQNSMPNTSHYPLATGSLPERIEALERSAILEALDEYKGHMGAAASYLGLTERVMGQRMRKYQISYKEFRK